MGSLDMFEAYSVPVEYVVDIPSTYAPAPEWESPVRIGISAVGGGTLGEAYAWHTWIWGVWYRGDLVLSSDDLRSTGVAATHEMMVRTLCTFLASDGSMLSAGRKDDHLQGYWPDQREFLEAEHERLSLFAYAGTAYEAEEEFPPDHRREITYGWETPSGE